MRYYARAGLRSVKSRKLKSSCMFSHRTEGSLHAESMGVGAGVRDVAGQVADRSAPRRAGEGEIHAVEVVITADEQRWQHVAIKLRAGVEDGRCLGNVPRIA